MSELKEKMQVVMLPIDKKPVIYKNQLVLGRSDNMLDLFSDHTSGPEDVDEAVNHLTKKFTTPQHLYICSRGIKPGETGWVIDTRPAHYGSIYNIVGMSDFKQFEDWFVTSTKQWKGPSDQYLKICATTDKSLGLPEPSREFIEAYIKQYNVGSPITEVMVEMELYISKSMNKELFPDVLKIKIDKNNNITITRVVEDWDDIRLLFGQFVAKTNSTKTLFEWFKENYNPPTKKK